MNPYNLKKGAMTGVTFFGFLIAMIINANFLPWGVIILAPISVIITYFVLGPLFKIMDRPLGKQSELAETEESNK